MGDQSRCESVSSHKRRKTGHRRPARASSSFSVPLTRSHPYNVQPLGNYYFSATQYSCRPSGLGLLHRAFSDAELLSFLTLFSVTELSALSRLSHAFYVFTREEEPYKQAVLAEWGGAFRFHDSWRRTLIFARVKDSRGQQAAERELDRQRAITRVTTRGFYSDVLFQPFYCSAIDLGHFNNAELVDRVRAEDLTDRLFLSRYGVPNIPFVVAGLMQRWPAAQWTAESLAARYGSAPFKCGAYTMRLHDYLQYAAQCQDESPLYLFDSGFADAERHPELAAAYTVPEPFADDLFALLDCLPAKEGYNDGCEDRETPAAHMAQGRARDRRRVAASRDCAGAEESKEESKEGMMDGTAGRGFGSMRPAYRWILIGPARSGSTFHKDPNHTSAWNGLLEGQKRWILYPPDQPPPGVVVSADGRDVATPISVAEWLCHYYAAHSQRLAPSLSTPALLRAAASSAAASPPPSPSLSTLQLTPNPSSYAGYGPVECVCGPGDVLFIPNGWWHLAVNLRLSVAVTQNFVSRQNVCAVLRFLKQEGNAELEAAFTTRLQEEYPGLVESITELERAAESSRRKPPTSLWQQLIA